MSFLAGNMQRMAMGSDSKADACVISMLFSSDSYSATMWKNRCFLSSSWKMTSKSMYAGSLVGVFFWSVAYIWLNRVSSEYDAAITAYQTQQYKQRHPSAVTAAVDRCCCCDDETKGVTSDSSSPEAGTESLSYTKASGTSSALKPLIAALSHKWLAGKSGPRPDGTIAIYPTISQHIMKTIIYTLLWTISYILMLMWMYFFLPVIGCFIGGYFVGMLIFNYSPVATFELPTSQELPASQELPDSEVPQNIQQNAQVPQEVVQQSIDNEPIAQHNI